LLAGLLVAAVIAVIWLLVARRRAAGLVEGAWVAKASTALDAATVAQTLLERVPDMTEPEDRARVMTEVEEAAVGLEAVMPDAPDDATRALVLRAAEGLRGVRFSVEAEFLLRQSSTPTGEQLAAADASRRASAAELDAALGRLRASLAELSGQTGQTGQGQTV
jgi:hypothetical protein